MIRFSQGSGGMNSFFDFVLALWVVDEEHWKVSGMNSERRYGFRLSAFAAALLPHAI